MIILYGRQLQAILTTSFAYGSPGSPYAWEIAFITRPLCYQIRKIITNCINFVSSIMTDMQSHVLGIDELLLMERTHAQIDSQSNDIQLTE